jgi:hypothetical protein
MSYRWECSGLLFASTALVVACRYICIVVWCYVELVFSLLSLVFLCFGGVFRAVELSLPRRSGCLNMGGQRGSLLWR